MDENTKNIDKVNDHRKKWIDFCLYRIPEDSRTTWQKAFENHKTEEIHTYNTYSELLLGAYLNTHGFYSEYDEETCKKTPDWSILDKSTKDLTCIVELANFYSDENTRGCIGQQMNLSEQLKEVSKELREFVGRISEYRYIERIEEIAKSPEVKDLQPQESIAKELNIIACCLEFDLHDITKRVKDLAQKLETGKRSAAYIRYPQHEKVCKRLCEKAKKYKDLVIQQQIPYVISICSFDLSDPIRHHEPVVVLQTEPYEFFDNSKHVSGVLFFQEAGVDIFGDQPNSINFHYIPNPIAVYPFDLPSENLSLK